MTKGLGSLEPAETLSSLPPRESGGRPRAVPEGLRFDAEQVTRRSITGGELPALWLDRLLGAACELPIGAGVDGVARALVDTLAGILPDYAFGLCIAATPQEDGQRVVRHVPGGPETDRGPDPSRLFPQFAFERVIAIHAAPAGSTLHCASDSSIVVSDHAPEVYLLERAAMLAASALSATRSLAEAKQASADLRGLQAQVIQSEKLASLGQIAAGVVHELNNPLTSIVAYSDYLRKKAERENADPNDVERLRRIGEAADRILRFSRDLVAYARPSNEVPAPVAIHAVIDQALVFCEHVLSSSSTGIERAFSAEVRPVRGVSGQLAQVFVNLFTNACHAMAEAGGVLSIATGPGDTPDTVRVTVTDNGHGIDGETLPRIFEPFFTTKTEGRGTGLGLSIVRDIVMLHGGTIAVTSQPGVGTRFVLDLPIAPRPPSEPPV